MSTIASVTEQADVGSPAENHRAAPSRLVSLDVFRGITIAAMILVNDPGSWLHIYGPLEHAEWNGWTHTDLIFPFFLFMAGVSMAFSFNSRLARGGSRKALLIHTVKRGAAIFAIGVLLHAYPFNATKLLHLRYLGVLQRIGIVYAIGGAVYLYTSARGRAATIVIALVGYWLLMRFVPVPGYGVGNMTPEGNLAAYLDRAIMFGHTWKPMWDPEGFLSSLPAAGTILLGSFVGEILATQSTWLYKVKMLLAGGVLGIVLGELMNLVFPINKNLWTSSFVVFTAGYAMLVLAACYWVIDVKKWRGWTMPFLVFGMNSILAYAISALVAKHLLMIHVGGDNLWSRIYNGLYVPHFADPRNTSLAFAISFVAVNWLIMLAFYKKKVFLKV